MLHGEETGSHLRCSQGHTASAAGHGYRLHNVRHSTSRKLRVPMLRGFALLGWEGPRGSVEVVKCDYCGKGRPKLWNADGKFCDELCYRMWLGPEVKP